MSLFRPFESSAERKTISLQKTEWIQPWSVRRTLFFCPNPSISSHIHACLGGISCNTMQNPSSIQPNFIWRCQHSWTRSWQCWNLWHRYLGRWGHRGAAQHPCFFFFAGKHGDNPLKLGVSWVSGFRGKKSIWGRKQSADQVKYIQLLNSLKAVGIWVLRSWAD